MSCRIYLVREEAGRRHRFSQRYGMPLALKDITATPRKCAVQLPLRCTIADEGNEELSSMNTAVFTTVQDVFLCHRSFGLNA